MLPLEAWMLRRNSILPNLFWKLCHLFLPLVAQIWILNFFHSSHSPHLNPVPLSYHPIDCLDGNVMFFHFLGRVLLLRRLILGNGFKNLKGSHLLFIRLFLFQCFSFVENFFSPFGFHSCIFSSLCRSI